jgi:hypothetical protein
MRRHGGGLRGARAEHPERGPGPQALGVEVEIATRAPDGRWWSVFLHGLEDELSLEALGIGPRLTEMYAGTRASG